MTATDDPRGTETMTTKTCIYPGCDQPAVPPHQLGGPQPAFCDSEAHNALSAHLERQRITSSTDPNEETH